MLSPLRAHLLEIFRSAVQAVNGRARVGEYLRSRPVEGPVYLAAIGKAAAAMTLGALDACGPSIERGLVISKQGYLDPALVRRQNLACMEAGHPVPDRRSLDAGTRLLAFVDATPADCHFLFLISGGASSLVEVLPEGVTLEGLHRVNEWLLASGLDVSGMNRVRKSLSCIKGGRLALHLGARRALALLISDVRGDHPGTIGSGLLVPDGESVGLAASELPEWVRRLMGLAPSVPGAAELGCGNVETRVVATLADARRAAVRRAQELGYKVYVHEEFVDGEAAVAGSRLAGTLVQGPPGIHVWGGETTVRLPPNPGRGGRSQSLALAAALEMQNARDAVLLAAGTDGTDGPGDDAGALVDGGTVARGELHGLNARRCLEAADAGTFLELSGDLVQTGPTGTNVMDLVIGLQAP